MRERAAGPHRQFRSLRPAAKRLSAANLRFLNPSLARHDLVALARAPAPAGLSRDPSPTSPLLAVRIA